MLSTKLYITHLFETFCKHTKRSYTYTSVLAVNDGKLYKRVKDGGRVWPETYEKVVQWFSDNWPADLEWPVEIERPLSKQQLAQPEPSEQSTLDSLVAGLQASGLGKADPQSFEAGPVPRKANGNLVIAKFCEKFPMYQPFEFSDLVRRYGIKSSNTDKRPSLETTAGYLMVDIASVGGDPRLPQTLPKVPLAN